MKTLGNILWLFPFFGLFSALLTLAFGAILTVTIVGAPIGLGLMELGKFLLWPFGNTLVSKKDLNVKQSENWQAYSTLITVLYFPFGLFAVSVGIIQVVLLTITIIGIPAALVIAKSLGAYLNPVNKQCVPDAVKIELDRRKASEEVDRHLSAKA